ncbi:hypothetical protein BGX26_007949 [Mortierella sp. AD094]|nr:hypothetical protein BGX26_007949 [Mortierella sp. AD094]
MTSSQQVDPSSPAYPVDPPANATDPGMDCIQKGDKCRDNGDFKEAAEHYEQAINFCPDLAQERLKGLPLDIGLFGELTARLEARTLQVRQSITKTSNKSPRESTLTGPYFPKRALSLRDALESEKSSVSLTFGIVDCAVGEPLTTISLVTSYAEADGASKMELRNQIKLVIMQFDKNFISLDTVQELVILATIPDREIFIGIANQMLKVLRDSPILSCAVLQGLAVILNSCPEQIDLSSEHGVFQDILKPITSRLSDIRQDKNGNQLTPILRAISALFDAMICRKVVGVDRDNIYLPLKKLLSSFASHSDPTVSFLAEYASQGLEFIGDDEPVQMTILRYGKLAFALAKGAKDIAINMDLSAFVSAYDNLTELCDFPKKYLWFQGLIYLNCAMGLKDWSQFETFVFKSKLKSNEKFLQGVCLYLERIVATQVNEDVRSGATRFLYALESKSCKQVQQVAQDALRRLGIQTETGTSTKGALSLFASRFVASVVPAVSQDNIPPVWDPLWYSNPSNVLLKVVQAREQRDANISKLLQQVENLKSEMKADNAELKADMDARFSQIQIDVTLIKDSNITTPSTLEDVHVALQEHYKGQLTIQRVSGDIMSLESCFVNLSVVAAQDQRQKYKKELKANQSATYQEPEETNVLVSIPIEELFNTRMLRDGREDVPKTILIHGRAGVGKTTLCKKLVHLYRQGGLWRDRFDAVLWLPLRQLRILKPRNLEDLLHQRYFLKYGNKEKEKLVLSVINLARNGRVLFALDGLDEIVKDTQSQDGFILEEFLKDLLQNEHVVITSRPSGVDKSILPKLDLEFEAVGFSPENVTDYVSMAFESTPESANAVRDFIERTPLVQGLVNIPVQLDAICYSWSDLPSDGKSVTMTMLYQTMVRKLCFNDAIRLEKSAGLLRKQGKSVGRRQIEAMLEPEIECLEYLAFRGMKNEHQIEFDESTIRKTGDELDGYREEADLEALPIQLFDNLKQMSFLHTADADLDPGKDDSRQSWYFLHLTFQEYFAAAWLVRHLQSKRANSKKTSVVSMTPVETTTFVQKHKYDPRYEIVWRMVAGQLEGSALESFFDLLQRPPRDLIGSRHRLLLAGCYMESRPSLSDDAVKWIEKELQQWLYFKNRLTGVGFNESTLNWQSVIAGEVSGRSLGKATDVEMSWITGRVAPAVTYFASSNHKCDIPALVRQLESENFDARKSAAKTLALQPDLPESAVTAFITALQDDNLEIRELAAEALGRQQLLLEYAIAALVASSKDEDPVVRKSVVEALGRQSPLPEFAIAALVASLQDESWDVRGSAAKEIGKQPSLPDYAITALIASFQDVEDNFRSSTENTSAQDVRDNVRSLAVDALGRQSTLPEFVITAITAALKDKSVLVRTSAVRILLRQPLSESIIIALASVLKDMAREMKRSIVDAFDCQPMLPEPAITALEAALRDEYFYVRQLSAYILGRQPTLSEHAIANLVANLRDRDQIARSAAVNVLGGPRICQAVSRLSTDEIEKLYKEFLFEYCCAQPVSLYIHDNRLQFYTERGFGQSDTLSADAMNGVLSAFLKVQNDNGIQYDSTAYVSLP